MSKSVYEMWFLWPNGTKSRLPVLPEVLNISNESQNESVSIAGLGEVTIFQDPMAKVISFSSFLPMHQSPLVEYASPSQPWVFIERFELFKKSKKAVRIIITGTPVNMAVSIESLNYNEAGGAVGDINYNIVLKEYKAVISRKIDTKKKTPTKGNVARPDTKTKAKTHTVKKDETLWAIAKIEYKNSAEWKKIWNANKDALIKRDKRNIKQPGHWIYPGQVLKLP